MGKGLQKCFSADEATLLLDLWERLVSQNGPIDRSNFIQVCQSLSPSFFEEPKKKEEEDGSGDCPNLGLEYELIFENCDPTKSGLICKEEWLHFLSLLLREKKTQTLRIVHDDHTVIPKSDHLMSSPQKEIKTPQKPKDKVSNKLSLQVPALLRMKEAMKDNKTLLNEMWGIVRHEDFLLSQWGSSSSSSLPTSKLISTCKAMAAIRMRGHRAGSYESRKKHLFLDSSIKELQKKKNKGRLLKTVCGSASNNRRNYTTPVAEPYSASSCTTTTLPLSVR